MGWVGSVTTSQSDPTFGGGGWRDWERERGGGVGEDGKMNGKKVGLGGMDGRTEKEVSWGHYRRKGRGKNWKVPSVSPSYFNILFFGMCSSSSPLSSSLPFSRLPQTGNGAAESRLEEERGGRRSPSHSALATAHLKKAGVSAASIFAQDSQDVTRSV